MWRIGATPLLSLAVLSSSGCRCEDAQSHPPPSATVRSPQPSIEPRTGHEPASDFALLPTPTGASVLWLERQSLVLAAFDRLGTAITPPQRVSRAGASDEAFSDLEATWIGSNLAAIWLAQQATDASRAAVVRGWVSGPDRETFELGPAWPAPRRHRGNLALALRGDHALAMIRGPRGPCARGDRADRGACFPISFFRIGENGEVTEAGVPLSVPVPCKDNSSHLLSLGEQWHYSVCTERQGATISTVFSITPSPEYAEARDLLPGCTPLGLTHWAGQAWLVGNCAGARHAVKLSSSRPEPSLRLEPGKLVCDSGHATIQAGPVSLPLREPRRDLELLLDLSPSSERAIWTGQRMMTLRRVAGGLRLRLTQCDGSTLLERDEPLAEAALE